MWDFATQPGLATGVVDFTEALSPLVFGFFGLLVLSVGLIAFIAIRHYFTQKTASVSKTAPVPQDRQEAA